MSETQTVACYKFTLPSKKTILLREPKISDTRLASQIAGKKAGTNQAHLGVLMQEELVKLLLIDVDGNKLKASDKERLDSLFSLKEYTYVLQAIEKITEDDSEGELQMEITTGQ